MNSKEENTLIKFQEEMVETFILDCKEDFKDVQEGSFLQSICQKDNSLNAILTKLVINGLLDLINVMPFPLTIILNFLKK